MLSLDMDVRAVSARPALLAGRFRCITSRPVSIMPLVCLVLGFAIYWHVCPAYGQTCYVEVDTGAMIVQGPAYRYFGTQDNDGNAVLQRFTTDNGNDAGVAIGGAIGKILHHPLAGADGSRIEFGGFYTDMEQTTTAELTASGTNRIGWGLLNNSILIGFGGGDDISTTTRRALDWGAYHLMLHQDFRIADNRMLTLYLGPSFQHFYQGTNVSAFHVQDPTDSMTLLESLDTDYYGAKIGLSCRHVFNSNWTLVLDASVAPYGAHSRYHGELEDVNNGAVANQVQASMTRSNFALGAQGKVELTRAIHENLILSFFGDIHYLNYAPQMSYGDSNLGVDVLTVDADELLGVMVGMNVTLFR